MRPLLHIVLFAPEIPQNTGSVGRLCVNLDARLHLIRPLGFDLSESKLKRAGLDYWPFLDLQVHETWQSYLDDAAPDRMHFLSTKASKSLYDATFQAHDHLVFGQETRGLPPDFYARYAEQLYRIPMPGAHNRSLNLANSVAIAAYEAFRQVGT